MFNKRLRKYKPPLATPKLPQPTHSYSLAAETEKVFEMLNNICFYFLSADKPFDFYP